MDEVPCVCECVCFGLDVYTEPRESRWMLLTVVRLCLTAAAAVTNTTVCQLMGNPVSSNLVDYTCLDRTVLN